MRGTVWFEFLAELLRKILTKITVHLKRPRKVQNESEAEGERWVQELKEVLWIAYTNKNCMCTLPRTALAWG